MELMKDYRDMVNTFILENIDTIEKVGYFQGTLPDGSTIQCKMDENGLLQTRVI